MYYITKAELEPIYTSYNPGNLAAGSSFFHFSFTSCQWRACSQAGPTKYKLTACE